MKVKRLTKKQRAKALRRSAIHFLRSMNFSFRQVSAW